MLSLTTDLEPEFDREGRLLVSGFDLRYTLAVALASERRAMTIPELHRQLTRQRLVPRGRPSRAISDALREEIRRRRVVRLRRGVYRIDVVPRPTLWRIRQHVKQLELIGADSGVLGQVRRT